jgi:hypothetical protein
MEMTFRNLGLAAMLLLALAGCASGPRYADVPAPVAADRAIVVVYRAFSMQGAAWTHGVFVDGRHVADLKNDGFTRISVAPGEHQISTGTKSKPIRIADKIDMIAGQTYFFGEHPSMMAYVPQSLERVDQAKAQKWLKGMNFQPPLVPVID